MAVIQFDMTDGFKYVSTIFHTAIHITRNLTGKSFSMKPEYEIIGNESSGRVDYAIKVRIFISLFLFFSGTGINLFAS
jgi:hypothetical protein